jgi:hypothetical protein
MTILRTMGEICADLQVSRRWLDGLLGRHPEIRVALVGRSKRFDAEAINRIIEAFSDGRAPLSHEPLGYLTRDGDRSCVSKPPRLPVGKHARSTGGELDRPAFVEGYAASNNGFMRSENPYRRGATNRSQRRDWRAGWEYAESRT